MFLFLKKDVSKIILNNILFMIPIKQTFYIFGFVCHTWVLVVFISIPNIIKVFSKIEFKKEFNLNELILPKGYLQVGLISD